jgi:hypothetical protein
MLVWVSHVYLGSAAHRKSRVGAGRACLHFEKNFSYLR